MSQPSAAKIQGFPWMRLIASLLVMTALLFFVLRHFSYGKWLEMIHAIEIEYLIASLVLYLAAQVFRGIRFKFLLTGKVRFPDLLGIVLVHNFFLNLFPARLGEISYLKMISSREISFSKNAFSLLVARISDLVMILLMFLAFASYSTVGVHARHYWIAAIGVGGIIFFFWKRRLLFTALYKANARFLKRFERVSARIEKTFRGLEQELQGMTKGVLIFLAMASFCIWLFNFTFNFVLFRGLEMRVGFFEIIVLSIILQFVVMIPVNPPGHFGTVESVWVLGLAAIGIDKELGACAALYVHFVQLGLAVMFGIAGFFLLAQRHPKKTP